MARKSIYEPISDTPRYKKSKRLMLVESLFWILAGVIYAISGNWIAVLLAVIIVLKVHQLWWSDRLYLLLDNLMSNLLSTLQEATEVEMKRENKVTNRLVKETK